MLRGQLVLLVEDERGIGLPLMSAFRRRAGVLDAEVVAGYRGAVERLERQPTPDVAILDYYYGEADHTHTGVHLALWMRDQKHLAKTRRVLYSGIDRSVIEATLADLIAQNAAPEGLTLDTLFAQVIPKGQGPLALIKILNSTQRS